MSELTSMEAVLDVDVDVDDDVNIDDDKDDDKDDVDIAFFVIVTIVDLALLIRIDISPGLVGFDELV